MTRLKNNYKLYFTNRRIAVAVSLLLFVTIMENGWLGVVGLFIGLVIFPIVATLLGRYFERE